MQECFARYPTVYNKAGSPEDDDDFGKDIDDAKNAMLATQSNVETVDQLEGTDTNSNKPDSPAEVKDKQ